MRSAVACLATIFALPVFAQGTLTGHVREPSGFGVAGADVRIGSGPIVAITDERGAFRVQGIAAGSIKVTARRMGFRPGTNDVTILQGATVDVTIALELAPIQLEQVTVTEHREPFDARLAGFNARIQKKVGTFITRDRIEASASSDFSDLLRGIPGVHLGASQSGIRNGVRFRGADCPPLVFIDGFPASAGEFDVDIIDPATVEGVEIYMGMLSVPAEFVAPRGLEHCGVIAVWSRPFRPKARPPKPITRAELQRMVERSAVFTADEVDSAARVVPGSFSPIYPDSLWKAGVDGHTLVEFVVDSAGRVEMPFFSIVSASRPEFGESVREAIGITRFVPARKGGRHVRQIVQLPTSFKHPAP